MSRLSLRLRKHAVPKQDAAKTKWTTSSSDSDNTSRVYVISKFWYAEDLSSAKGDGSQVVATVKSLAGANAYAADYEDDVLKQAREEYEYYYARDDPRKAEDTCARRYVSEKTSDDGTKSNFVDWNHLTQIVVQQMPLLDSERDVEKPSMIMYSTGGR